MYTATDRLADKLASRTATAGIERLDLAIADHVMLKDKKHARVLIAFDSKLGNPTADAIASFITRKFGGRIVANTETAQWIQNHSVVSCVVGAPRLTRQFNDRKGLTTVIANTLFLDQSIGANWQVETNPAGGKYLVQVRDEDVAGLLAGARTRNATASFSGAQMAVSFILPEKDDRVEFFAEGGLRQGVVTKVNGTDLTITEDDGSTYLVEAQAVTKMIRKNSKAAVKEEEALINALTPTMGDRKLAEELVRGSKR
jgi:hypothetical protein